MIYFTSLHANTVKISKLLDFDPYKNTTMKSSVLNWDRIVDILIIYLTFKNYIDLESKILIRLIQIDAVLSYSSGRVLEALQKTVWKCF